MSSHAAVQKSPTIINVPDARLGQAALAILRQLRPMDVVDGRLIRRGRRNDGGYVMLGEHDRAGVAYSFGISDDVSWDLEMAALGYQVYQYDHTVPGAPHNHPNFHFFRNGIAAETSADGVFLSIDEILRRNGHKDRHDIVLKMDIEAAEWAVFNSLSSDTLGRFSQILVELHRLAQISDAELLTSIQRALAKLNETHQVYNVHANNYGWLGFIGGVTIPDTLEVSYAKRSNHSFVVCDKCFPTEMDMPCDPEAPDYFIGPLGHL